MARVGDITPMVYHYPSGENTMADEHGWIYILDSEGLSIGAHPRDRVECVFIDRDKAGETTVTSDNSKDGN